MRFVQPLNTPDGTKYNNGDPLDGSQVDAQALNVMLTELTNLVTDAGLTPDLTDTNLHQVSQAVQKLIQAGISGIVIEKAVFSGGVTDGKPVRWNGAAFVLAMADGTADDLAVGFADVTNAQVYCFGQTRTGLFSGLTPGSRYYLSATGTLVTAAATDVVYAGIALTATSMFVDIDPGATALKLADNSLKSVAAGLQVNEAITFLSANAPLTATNHHLANIVATAACTLTLPKAATVGMMAFDVSASGGAVTLAPNAADIVQGSQSSPTAGANFILPQGSSAFVVTDGVSNWWLFNVGLPSSVGKHTLSIPAGAIAPRVTNGALPMAWESATNHEFFRTLEFDPNTNQYGTFLVMMPKSWNGDTVTAQFVWAHYTTTVNFGVAWAIQGAAYANAGALDVAPGTAVQVNCTGGAGDTAYVSAESGAITISNSPVAGSPVLFTVSRVATAATYDTLAVNAKLLGVKLFYTTNAATDA